MAAFLCSSRCLCGAAWWDIPHSDAVSPLWPLSGYHPERGGDLLPPEQRPGLQARLNFVMNIACPYTLVSIPRNSSPWASSTPFFLQGSVTHCTRNRHPDLSGPSSIIAVAACHLWSHGSVLKCHSVSSSSCLPEATCFLQLHEPDGII